MLAAVFAATLALIPAPAATIVRAPCPAATEAMTTGACAYADQGTIYLPDGSTRFMLQHELGHVFDAQHLDDGERHKIARSLGVNPDGPWRTPDPYRSGMEKFADAYAACRLRMDPDHGWESSYDYYPSRRAFRRLCATIARAADYGDGTTR
jgi:hypothetical protein